MKPRWEQDEDVEVLDKEDLQHSLIVFNDHINTFETVIITLMQVCKHSLEQAEQCTLIIHNKGKCSVKQGEFEELVNMKRQINSVGIDAKVV